MGWSNAGGASAAGVKGKCNVLPERHAEQEDHSCRSAEEALPGRVRPIPTAAEHHVSKRPLKGPYPEGLETAMFGMGCFWGAERLFWQTEGVWVTAVGYAGGHHAQPDLPGDLHRTDRPCRGGACLVFDPEDRLLRRPSEDLLGESTTRRRACARATMSARPTARRSTRLAKTQHQAAVASRDAYEASN